MVVNHDTYNGASGTSVTGLADLASLTTGAITAFKDDLTLLDGDGSDTFAGSSFFRFFLNRTNGGMMDSPPIDVATMSYRLSDGAAETPFIKYLGDDGTTTTNSVDLVLGTPVAGDVHIILVTDPSKNFKDPLAKFSVEYVVLASDTTNELVLAGIVAAWNANTKAAALATAAVVGSTTGLGMRFTGVAGKQMHIQTSGDLYPLAAAVGVTDTAYKYPVNGIAEIIEQERQSFAELGGSDSYINVPGLRSFRSNVIAEEVYNAIVINWSRGGNTLTSKHEDKQELVIFCEDADAVDASIIAILNDVMTTRQ